MHPEAGVSFSFSVLLHPPLGHVQEKVMCKVILALGLAALATTTASAGLVQVDIVGSVEFNIANPNNPNTDPDILGIQVGDTLTYSFLVDSDNYLDSGSFPVRGYIIDPSSFTITTDNGFSTSLVNPIPFGADAYFVIRNNDPGVDGFYLTWGGVDFPGGLQTLEDGLFGDPFEAHFSVGYDVDTLSSLDILDAQGTYGYGSGGPGTLNSFYFNLVDLGFEVVGIEFTSMTITPVPAPATLALLIPMGLVRRRRRH